MQREILSNKQHINPIGRAGTGMVDLYTGNVKFVHEDLVLGGLKTPLQIYHVYDREFARTDSISDRLPAVTSAAIGLGRGWKTNLHQYIVSHPSTTVGQYEPEPKYVYIDHLGQEHILWLTQVKDSSGNPYSETRTKDGNLVLEDLPTSATLKDRNGNKLIFSSRSSYNIYVLTQIIDSAGNATNISFAGNYRIGSVTDGAGRTAVFSPNNGQITSLTCGGKTVGFAYTSDRLTGIIYPGGAQSEYAYDNQNDLISALDQSGVGVSYSQNGSWFHVTESAQFKRIEHGGEIAGGMDSHTLSITRGGNKTTISADNDERYDTIYCFDNDGNCNLSYSEAYTGPTQTEVESLQCTTVRTESTKSIVTVGSRTGSQNYLTTSLADPFEMPPNMLIKEETITTVPTVNGFVLYGYVTASSAQNINEIALEAQVTYGAGGQEWFRTNYMVNTTARQLAAVVFPRTNRQGLSATKIRVWTGASRGNPQPKINVDGIRLEEASVISMMVDGNQMITWDGSGAVSTHTADAGSNRKGNITRQEVTVSGKSFAADYGYNGNGQIATASDDNNVEGRNEYFPGGQLSFAHINQKNNTVQALTEGFLYDSPAGSANMNGNYLTRLNNFAQGNSAAITYNEATGELQKLYLNDGLVSGYEYYDSGLLKSVETFSDGRKITNEYFYTRGCLTRLDVYCITMVGNDTIVGSNMLVGSTRIKSFEFKYDGFCRLIGTVLITRENGQETKHQLSSAVYSSPRRRYMPHLDQNGGTERTYHKGNGQYYTVSALADYTGRNIRVRDYETFNLEIERDMAGRTQSVIEEFGAGYISYVYNYSKNQRAVSFSGYRDGNITDTVNDAGQPVARSVSFSQAGSVGPGRAANYTYEYGKPSGAGAGVLPTRLERVGFADCGIKYSYDGVGRLQGRNVKYTSNNNEFQVLNESYTYGQYGANPVRLTENVANINYAISGNYNLTDAAMEYEDGKLSQVSFMGSVIRYKYDDLGRLIREDNGALGITKRISYNPAGDISRVLENDFTDVASELLEPQATIRYHYDGRQRLMHTSVSGTRVNGAIAIDMDVSGLTYDNLGNPGSWRGSPLTWEKAAELTAYNGYNYRYDAFGVRQEKRSGGVLRNAYYTEGGLIHREERWGYPGGNLSLWYHYDATGIARLDLVYPSGTSRSFYPVKDAQGNVIAILGQTGALFARYEYDAWGNHRVLNQVGGVVTDPAHIGLLNPWRWRSQYYDIESGNYMLLSGGAAGTRYYDPRLGTVLNATLDDADVGGGYAYDLLNPYDIFPRNILGGSWWSPELYQPAQGGSSFDWKKDWWKIALSGFIIVGLVVGTIFTGGVLSVVLAGAALGAAGGFAGATISTAITGDWANWGNAVLVGTIVGGISGALSAVPGIGLLGQIGINAVLGMGNYAVTNAISGKPITAGGLAMSFVLGAVGGLIGGPGSASMPGLKEIFFEGVNAIVVGGAADGGYSVLIGDRYNPNGNFWGW